jgi:hypothetical protein
MISHSLDHIKQEVEALAQKIKAPFNLLPTYGYSRDFAYPHIEEDNYGLMHYVIVERGEELSRRSTDKLNDLLYWIFADVTFSMALTYELEHRIEEKDTRRLRFEKQEALLGMLNATWQQKEQKRHLEILKDHPFVDGE